MRPRHSKETEGPKRTSEQGPEADVRPLRILLYGLRQPDDFVRQVVECDGFELYSEPLNSPVSFLGYDGVIVFAGAFERMEGAGFMGCRVAAVSPADVDRRHREFFTLVQDGKFFIFMLPELPMIAGTRSIDPQSDLFRRVADELSVTWRCLSTPSSAIRSGIPEFQEYVSKFGSGYLTLEFHRSEEGWAKPICGDSRHQFGAVISGKIFLLPCTVPQFIDQVVQMATEAVAASIAYRRRISTEMPDWAGSFAFKRESNLRGQARGLYQQLSEIEAEIAGYQKLKGALCYRSDPLVEIVAEILDRFLGVSLTLGDNRIEDAIIQSGDGETLAVVEIKGVNGSFIRENVNQVDSHRERLNLPAAVRGILIMNTIMSATSLEAKDQAPHVDIIKKAVAEGVLLIRTLDLLRYVDLVERKLLTKESFRETLLAEAGWLKVEGGAMRVVKQ